MSIIQITNEYECKEITIYRWLKSYELIGEKSFDLEPKNKAYTKEFKIKVIKKYLDGNSSLADISRKRGIFSISLFLVEL